MAVDAHHHFWNLDRCRQPWMTDEHTAIARTFEPPDLEPLLAEAGVRKTVLVQGAACDEDTDYLFEIAEEVPWVGAVVAWCRLDDEQRARSRLDELAGNAKLRGIRHLIHQENDPHWIMRSSVRPALSMLEDAGLLLELPAVYPRHLDDVPELADRHLKLQIVIDHLGKPPLGTVDMADWEQLIRRAAERPNVYAKISGLNTAGPTGRCEASFFEPAVEVAVDAFGPDRLACGSDWPVALLNGTYRRVWHETVTAVSRVAGDGSQAILTGTPKALYHLGA